MAKRQPEPTDDSLPGILRRRAKQLQVEEHYNDQYVSVFLRAADELERYHKSEADPVLQTAKLHSKIDGLKPILHELSSAVHGSTMERSRRDRCEKLIGRAMAIVKERDG